MKSYFTIIGSIIVAAMFFGASAVNAGQVPAVQVESATQEPEEVQTVSPTEVSPAQVSSTEVSPLGGIRGTVDFQEGKLVDELRELEGQVSSEETQKQEALPQRQTDKFTPGFKVGEMHSLRFLKSCNMGYIIVSGYGIATEWFTSNVFFFEKIAPLVGLTVQELESRISIMFHLSSFNADGTGGVSSVMVYLSSSDQRTINIGNFDEEAQFAFQTLYRISYNYFTRLYSHFISAFTDGGLCREGPNKFEYAIGDEPFYVNFYGGNLILEKAMGMDPVDISPSSTFYHGPAAEGFTNAPLCF